MDNAETCLLSSAAHSTDIIAVLRLEDLDHIDRHALISAVLNMHAILDINSC